MSERASSAPEGPLLVAGGLVKHFPIRDALGRAKGAVRAVDGVSLTLRRGETLAIVGESGCGKSTLGRLLLRLVEPDAGRLQFGGEDMLALRPAALRARRRRMQLIFQDPYGSLDPRMTVEAAIREPLRLHGLHRGREAERVAELLSRVGLRPEQARRWPHEFSGGQRQRIAIARALASEPELVIGDEPVSALDVSVQAQVVNLLAGLIRELGLTFVLISHDLGVVRHVADRVAVMYLGRIVEEGPGEQVFSRPSHPYTRALLAAVPGQGGGAVLEGDVPSPVSPPPGCRFHTRCPFAQEICRTMVPELAPRSLPEATPAQGGTLPERWVAGAALLAAPSPDHLAACHFQDSLPPPAPIREAAADARLAHLQSFFSRETTP